MKQLDNESVGGRIRQLRKECGQSQQEFAEAIGITGNYLGLIERGARQAAPGLLKKIAAVVDVDYRWLAYGETPEEAAASQNDTFNNNEADLAAVLHPQLYLSIIMQRVPTMTRDILATFLLTTPEVVDRILAGEPVSYDPRWGMSYSVLAQNTDIAALRQDLRNIDDFLAREEARLRIINLHRALFELAAEKMGGEVEACPDDPDYCDPSASNDNLYLRSKADHTKTWYFRYCPFLGPIDSSTVQAWMDSMTGNESLVLTDATAFDSVHTYLNDLEGKMDALDNLPGASRPTLPVVSLIFYNEKTGKAEETIFFADQF